MLFFIYKICRFDFQTETFDFANGVLISKIRLLISQMALIRLFISQIGFQFLNEFVSVHVAVTCDRAHGCRRYVRTYKAHGT